MTDALFFAAFLTLPLFGLWTWRLDAVRRMDLAGRLAVAGAVGAVTTAVILAVFPFWSAAAQEAVSKP